MVSLGGLNRPTRLNSNLAAEWLRKNEDTMIVYYLDTTDIHELRSHETLGAAYGVAFLTHEAAADALAALDDDGDLEIVETDALDLPGDVRIPAAGFAIVAGDEGPVYGVGATEAAAMAAALTAYDPTREAPEVVGWQYRDAADTGLVYSIPCTQAMLDVVAAKGGAVAFDVVGRGRRAVAVV